MKHLLPDLPYPKTALEPFLSAETLDVHHDKHHRAYVEKLNRLVVGTGLADLPLEDVVRQAEDGPLFNQAAQAWNHAFFWHCLTPTEHARPPTGALQEAIDRDFGSLAEFTKRFQKAAAGVFGSGWAWLVRGEGEDGRLVIETTSNAGTPLRDGREALLTVDVWEHAYYIDYRNDREKYLEALPQVLNWGFAEQRFLLQLKSLSQQVVERKSA